MTTEIIISNLGNLVPSGIRYSETSNAFLSDGYVSAANNVYYNAVRFAEGIVIKDDIGQGWAHTFLNGIKIYSLKDRVLLADRTYNNNQYSKEKVLRESREMLVKLIYDAAEKTGSKLNNAEVIQTVNRILTEAFKSNQMNLAQSQMKKLL